MARTKTVVLRLSEEEYNLLKELSGREPMNAYLRRVALQPEPRWAKPPDIPPEMFEDSEEWQKLREGAEPQEPSPSEPPVDAYDIFKCPVPGCPFRATSSVARCPAHGRVVVVHAARPRR